MCRCVSLECELGRHRLPVSLVMLTRVLVLGSMLVMLLFVTVVRLSSLPPTGFPATFGFPLVDPLGIFWPALDGSVTGSSSDLARSVCNL